MTNEPKKALHHATGRFSWVILALKSRRTMKTWTRCCVAFAATMTLMVSTKTSDTMGQAAFFSVIVAVMLAPTLALSVFLVAAITLLLGMLIGWAWGNAAMASALAVRSSSLFMQQQQKLAASIDPQQSIDLQTRVFTFHGNFLDPRSSAIYGVFLFVGAYVLGAIRAYFPNLTILTLFGTIVLDVVCTTGPLLPTANYTLPKLFLIPTAFYVAVAVGSLVLVFPESLSHVWMTSMVESFWNPILDILLLQTEALNMAPSDVNAWAEMNARGVLLRERLIRGLDNLTSQIKLINVDASVGRLGPSDLKRINSELKSIVFRASGLHSFSTFVNDINQLEAKDPNLDTEEKPPMFGRYQDLLTKTKERELMHGHDLDSLVPILQSASTNIRASMNSSLICVIDWFQQCNSRRITGLFRSQDTTEILGRRKVLQDELTELAKSLEEFRVAGRAELIKPYEKFFHPETRELITGADMFASRSLYTCFVYIDTVDAFAERMIDMMKTIIDIDTQRPAVKIWYPGGFSTLKENIVGNDFSGLEGSLGMGSSQDPTSFETTNRVDSNLTSEDDEGDNTRPSISCNDKATTEKISSAAAPKESNPDAFPPDTSTGRFLVKVSPIFHFFISPEGILAFRSGILSVALWIPAVCPQSAWFYYDNKGIWALIMAQTGLATYAGSQIADFVLRLTGTVIGLLAGMTVWYIGSGLGHGNPYGVVVASTVVVSPFLLARISAPLSQVTIWLMAGVTTVFVVGYSWVNAHQFILANSGVGVAIGWKRALLVIIGFASALLIMLFPNPTSSRVLVRKTLAAIAAEVGHIFGGEIESFVSASMFPDKEKSEIFSDTSLMVDKEKRVRYIAGRVIAVSKRLRFIEPSLTTAKFEPQLTGMWPQGLYKELYTLQVRMLGALGILIISFAKLDAKWCSALIQRTAYLNPNFLSDMFMMIKILSDSLISGQHLPAQLPRLRDRLVYHEQHSGRLLNTTLFSQSPPLKTSSQDDKHRLPVSGPSILNKGTSEQSSFPGPSHLDGVFIGLELQQLTLDVLLHAQLPVYSSAVVALSSLVSRIDEMADIIRILCGEASFQGFHFLQQDREEYGLGKFGR